jgi:hypothetical protein
MNAQVLIDAIVRQTTVLIAQLATATGARAMLAHTANQVFVDLARELKAQGMTHAVIADMFGLALRGYHKKVSRLSESVTFRGQSLWSAVLSHVQEHGPLLRTEVLRRFRNDDAATLRGVLSDMVEGGALYASGSGDSTVYRVMDDPELAAAWRQSPEQLAHLVWVAVYRFGPLALAELRQIVPVPEAAMLAAVHELSADGRIARDDAAEPVRYRTERCFIPVDSAEGWEAAVFDHYQAVVTAICNKLQWRARGGDASEVIGGSTYRYTVWPGHPHRDEVRGLLTQLRAEAVRLRERVETYNANHDASSEEAHEQFVAYVGQTRLLAELDLEVQGENQ